MTEPHAREEPATDDPEWQPSEKADKALDRVLADLRGILSAKASLLSKIGTVSDDDIYRAYQQLSFPNKNTIAFADAQEIVSRALRENRCLEWISYGMAVVLFLFGLLLLGAGVAFGDVAARAGALFSGSIVEILILIPFRVVVNSRRQNIALRMLGIILNRVNDPRKVAPLLRDTFLAVVLGKAHFRGLDGSMFNWLRRIDDAAFSPPHEFEAVLAFVMLRLGCTLEDESGERVQQDAPSERTEPHADHP